MTNEEKMTPEEAIAEISFLKVAVNKVMEQALDMAIQALSQEPTDDKCHYCEHNFTPYKGNTGEFTEQEPCDDAISRKAVEEITWEEPSYTDALNVLTEVRDKVRALPSVTQKSGKWIEHKNNGMDYIECSKCSSWFLRMYLTRNSYCPNCGCRMFEPRESEDKE